MTFEYPIAGRTTHQLMSAIASALRFPDYFGYNLDALYDCLTDLSWLPDGDYVLVWQDPGALRAADGPAYDAIATVLADAVADGTSGGAHLSVRFQTD